MANVKFSPAGRLVDLHPTAYPAIRSLKTVVGTQSAQGGWKVFLTVSPEGNWNIIVVDGRNRFRIMHRWRGMWDVTLTCLTSLPAYVEKHAREMWEDNVPLRQKYGRPDSDQC